MSRHKYVTPHWTDIFDRNYDAAKESHIDTSTMTELFFLNAGSEETKLTIYFYDGSGTEFEKIRVNSVIQSNHSYYLRIGDLIEKVVPNYVNESNSRSGWLKIISSNELIITGKIVSRTRADNRTIDEVCWTIPFFETELIGTQRIDQNPIDDVSKEPLFKKIPRPFPR